MGVSHKLMQFHPKIDITPPIFKCHSFSFGNIKLPVKVIGFVWNFNLKNIHYSYKSVGWLYAQNKEYVKSKRILPI